MNYLQHNAPPRLDTHWETMTAEKGDLIARCENYARLTIPSICPEQGTESGEQRRGYVAKGPRLVNSLANKIVDTMFPHDRPFFTVSLTPKARRKVRDEIGEDNEAAFAEQVRTTTAGVEQEAMRTMDLTAYRPQAVEAVRHKIITGNVCIRRAPSGKRVIYGVKDFCVRRNIEGEAIEVLLRDAKALASLDTDIRQLYKNANPGAKDTDILSLYTHFVLIEGRWTMLQGVNGLMIDRGIKYLPKDLPVLVLAWSLARGENYGRGLVEEHITVFHNIDVSSCALLEMIGILTDIKFLVDPASVLDVQELNASPRGSYHQGREGDITTPAGLKNLSIGELRDVISTWETEAAMAFLMNSSGIRDAERVTAEEIRFIARELNTAFGGLYSRLAIAWQKHEAVYAVSQIDFSTVQGNLELFEVLVTTGLESLSREGQLQNMREAISDLQMLDAVPEDVRAVINPMKFAAFIFTNHTVPLGEFMFSREEVEANKAAAMKEQQDLAQIQSTANVQEEAGKKAVNESK